MGLDARFSTEPALTAALATVVAIPVVLHYLRKAKGHRELAHSAGRGLNDSRVASEDNMGFGNVSVSKLLVHPIKSCRGTSLQESRYSPEGLEFDRQWCIIDASSSDVLTARDLPTMVLITPQVEKDPSSPSEGVLRVSFPETEIQHVEDFTVPLRPTAEQVSKWEVLNDIKLWGGVMQGLICQSAPGPSNPQTPSNSLSAFLGRPVHLIYKPSKHQLSSYFPRVCTPTDSHPSLDASFVYQDTYPLLFLSEASVETISKEVKEYAGGEGAPPFKAGAIKGIREEWKAEKVPIERFRPNIVLKVTEPFAEDRMTEISIIPRDLDPSSPSAEDSSHRFFVVSKCARCLLPNVDPRTGIRDAAIPFKVLMKFRTGVDPKQKLKACVGCNGVPLGEGTVKVGDLVIVRKVAGM